MNQTTIRARSLPYREPRPGTYKCGRCGGERDKNRPAHSGYCPDCITEARALGWAPKIKERTKAA